MAGLVDGEGWIGIHQLGRKNGVSRRMGQYRICVEVANTNKAMVDFLHTRLGGSVSYRGQKNKSKAHWKWRVSSYNALLTLDALYPYLMVKKPQAKLCRRFQRYTQSPSRIPTAKAFALQTRIHDEVKFLNRRGVEQELPQTQENAHGQRL